MVTGRLWRVRFGKNNSALGSLFMAEMAEGKGRFVDQIINGVFASCEMTELGIVGPFGITEGRRMLSEL